MNNKGIASLMIIGIVLGILVLGGGGYYLYKTEIFQQEFIYESPNPACTKIINQDDPSSFYSRTIDANSLVGSTYICNFDECLVNVYI